ncbi:GNAT family N-acetyltransferase [Bacillus sp. CGMCC 1.16607]|uniref:GNAT family N-acetyltransferase n=1 Tax=Bacillus sp. CGMCC 1.16607 TaxID=3351842 RepID=UPI0036295489
MVCLAFYEERFRAQLFEFSLPSEQHQFTGLPVDVLEISVKDKDRFPIVILDEDDVVGFFILHYGEEISSFSKNPNAILLRALSINYKHQGKGYGKLAMEQLPSFVKENFPQFDEIVLAVNMKNIGAKKLYDNVGFIDRGERRVGKIGPQYILHYGIKTKYSGLV